MELANHSTQTWQTRSALPDDARAINRLLQTANFAHFHADWQLPVDWIGKNSFLVAQNTHQPENNRFLGDTTHLAGCLAIVGTPPPVAWIRLAGVKTELDCLVELMEKILPKLKQVGITQIGWLPSHDWVNEWAGEMGFIKATELETYVKMRMDILPAASINKTLQIHPIQIDEMSELDALETAVFAPLWRYDSPSLQHALHEARHFDVAILDQKIVGYIMTTSLNQTTTHLARLAVCPTYQGQGIASSLLIHVLNQYQQEGIQQMSLNTQIDNQTAQRLYTYFGFQPTGHRVPVWVKDL